MSLSTIAATLEAFASEVVTDAVTEAGAVGVKLKALAVSSGEEAVEDIGEGFEDLVNKMGKAASTLVTNLMADDSLRGTEKANLAATQLVEQGAQAGITIADNDATTLIKNAFLAVEAEIAKL